MVAEGGAPAAPSAPCHQASPVKLVHKQPARKRQHCSPAASVQQQQAVGSTGGTLLSLQPHLKQQLLEHNQQPASCPPAGAVHMAVDRPAGGAAAPGSAQALGHNATAVKREVEQGAAALEGQESASGVPPVSSSQADCTAAEAVAAAAVLEAAKWSLPAVRTVAKRKREPEHSDLITSPSMAQAALVLQAIAGSQASQAAEWPSGSNSAAHGGGSDMGMGQAMQMPYAPPELMQLPPRVRTGQRDFEGAAGQVLRPHRARPPLPPSVSSALGIAGTDALRRILPGWSPSLEGLQGRAPRVSLQLHMPSNKEQVAAAAAHPSLLAQMPTLTLDLPPTVVSRLSALLSEVARYQAQDGSAQVQLTGEQLQLLLQAAQSEATAEQRPQSPFASQAGSPFAQQGGDSPFAPPSVLAAPPAQPPQQRMRGSPVVRGMGSPLAAYAAPGALHGRSLLGLGAKQEAPASPFARVQQQEQLVPDAPATSGGGGDASPHPVVHVPRVRAKKGIGALPPPLAL